MIARFFDFLRGLIALALVIALLVGVPAVLLVIVGYPLPTETPSIELIRAHLEAGDIPDAFIIKTLAVVVWIVWAQLVVAVLTEAFALMRGRVAARAPVLPGLQLFAGKLVASTILIVTAFLPNRSAMAAPIAPIAPADVAVELAAGAGPNSVQHLIEARHGSGAAALDLNGVNAELDGQARIGLTGVTTDGAIGQGSAGVVADVDVAAGHYQTEPGDSWWDMAERLLGDGMRWSELRDLNSGRVMLSGTVIDERTEVVEGGWELRVPAEADASLLTGLPDTESAPVDEARAVEGPEPSPEPVEEHASNGSSPLMAAIKPYLLVYEGPTGLPVEEPSVAYQVVEGDNLWDIAERHLGDPFRWPEIFERSTDIEQSFGRSISDPNLIWPDAIIRLPADAVDVPPADADLVAEVFGIVQTPAPESPVEPTPEAEQPVVISPDDLAEAAAAARAATDSTEADSRPEPASTEAQLPVPVAIERPSPAARLIEALTNPAGAAVGTGGLLLATGLAGLLNRERRARRAEAGPRSVPAPPPPELVEIETVIRNRADDAQVGSIEAVIASLTDREIHPAEPLPAPEIVRIGQDRIEVVQQGPDPDLPGPWNQTSVSGHPGLAGRSIASLDVDLLPEPPSHESDLAIAPTLVTVGRGLLLNLETAGLVTVDGPVEAVTAMVNTMVHELATGYGRRSIGLRVSDYLPGADLYDHVRCGPLDDLASELRPWLERTELALTATGGFSAYALRAGGRGDAVPGPVVVFADASDVAAVAPIAAQSRRHALPLAVVVAGDGNGLPVEPSVRIETDGDRVTVHPFGLTAAAEPINEDVLLGLSALVNHARRAPMMVRNDQATILPSDVVTDPAQAPTEETPQHEIVTELPTEGDEITERDDDDAGVLIRVLGPIEIEGGPPVELAEEQRSLLTFLALAGPSTEDQVRQAVWPSGAVSDDRFLAVVDELRSVLGHRFPDAGDGRFRVRSIITDLGSARRWLNQAETMSGDRARNLLELALSEVRGTPFDGVPDRFWQWTQDHQMAVATQAVSMLVDAGFELCDAAYAANDLPLAVWACDVAALVDPLHETVATRRVQLLGVLGEHEEAANLVEAWEAVYHRRTDRRPPGGPRAALQSREVVAPNVG